MGVRWGGGGGAGTVGSVGYIGVCAYACPKGGEGHEEPIRRLGCRREQCGRCTHMAACACVCVCGLG